MGVEKETEAQIVKSGIQLQSKKETLCDLQVRLEVGC